MRINSILLVLKRINSVEIKILKKNFEKRRETRQKNKNQEFFHEFKNFSMNLRIFL